ncbi:hypothetical protein [Desulfogranum japonicum]|uniref:hypothetical protein n=1 Tax=Desulfogranum japonicum TaxID=231447 RepID=UPI00041FD447|nr:hypothetical protein [Desulfogranum japonicum]
MKTTKTLFLASLLACTVAVSAQAAGTIKELGRHPFHTPSISSVEELKSMATEEQQSIMDGFTLAGMPELYQPFMEQLAQTTPEVKEYAPGETLNWMLYKRNGNGRVRIMKDVTWGGEAPFTGFEVVVDYEGSRYTFVVPMVCSNVALKEIGAIPVAVNQDPTCSSSVTPVNAYCGEMVTIDASSSTDDSAVTSMKVTVVDSEGNVVSEEPVPANTLIYQMPMPCGDNTIQVTVIDDQGQEATSQDCQTAVTGKSRFRPVADLGYYKQTDPGDYFFIRGGMEYNFTEEFSVLGMVGIAPHFKGDDGETAFLVDVIANYSWNPVFVGFGLGGWISTGDNDLDTEDTDLDLILNVGSRIYGEPDEFNISLFLEGRAAVDELDDLEKYSRIGVGARFRF